jgi:hypothetical protein
MEPCATRREFDDLRSEIRDEIKWLRRMLVGTLTSAVMGSLVSAIFVVITR